MRNDEEIPDAAERETRWGRIYLGVIIYTAFLIAALWLFSRVFSN